MTGLKLLAFDAKAVIAEVTIDVRGDAAAALLAGATVPVSSDAIAAEVEAEREAALAALPERAELDRVDALLEQAHAQAKNMADAEDKLTTQIAAAVARGDTPPASAWSKLDDARRTRGRAAEAVAILDAVRAQAEDALEAARARALRAWRADALARAQEAERAALAAIARAAAGHIAAVMSARARLRTVGRFDPDETPPPQPDQAILARFGRQWREERAIHGQLWVPKDATLTPSTVESIPAPVIPAPGPKP